MARIEQIPLSDYYESIAFTIGIVALLYLYVYTILNISTMSTSQLTVQATGLLMISATYAYIIFRRQ